MINIHKMHTLGNDFVIFCLEDMPDPSDAWIQHIADRKQGIGCDQVLGYAPIEDHSESFTYRIFNANGCEVNQCGNGALCLSRFLFDHHVSESNALTLHTFSEEIHAIRCNDHVSVNLGTPDWEPRSIPLYTTQSSPYQLKHGKQHFDFHALSLGNPHAVIRCDDINTIDIDDIGSLFNRHPMFPMGVNVGFMQIKSESHMALRVYERGVGETMACGSGASAAAIIATSHFGLQSPVQVDLPGGTLTVKLRADNDVWLSGPTAHVFSTEWAC